MTDEQWITYFKQAGFSEAQMIGSGMEGSVYRLGDDRVGKVWGHRSESELYRLRDFYKDVAAAFPFATPYIYEVWSVAGYAVTLERELHGIPLQSRLREDDDALSDAAVECIVHVLKALRTAIATPPMRKLAVLDEPAALWAGVDLWADALIGLMHRRVRVFGSQLREQVPDFDAIYAGVVRQIDRLPRVESALIHGDLCGPNILVNEAGHPTAVLDFGFLTTAGDPALDASIAGGIYNMYGPYAFELDRKLTARLADELGYSHERLLLYRAAYAIMTSNAYDPGGRDGHFAWCAATLRREEIFAFGR